MKTKAMIIVMCLMLCFNGCQGMNDLHPSAAIGVATPDPELVSAASPTPVPAAPDADVSGAVPYSLPEEIDPLGFFELQMKDQLTAMRAAERMNAKYKTIPGVYEIQGIYLNGEDARMWLQTDADGTKVEQVALVHKFSYSLYDRFYDEIVSVLGAPDGLYVYDDWYTGRIPIQEYISEEHPFAVWDMEGYTLELGVNVPGNVTPGFYLAAFREEFDSDITIFFYEQEGPCCPHPTEFHFTPDSIFLDPELFQSETSEIFEKCRVTNAYSGERSQRFVGDYRYPPDYVVYGIDYLGCDAEFSFIEDTTGKENIADATYMIDITDMDAAEIQRIFLQIYDALLAHSTTVAEEYANDDPHALRAEAFDPKNWDAYNRIYYIMYYSSQEIGLWCSSSARQTERFRDVIFLSW